MEREQIIDKLTPIVRDVFANDSLELSDDMSAESLDAWTSLAFMQLLVRIEEEFGFRFKMLELLRLKTMGDIITSIGHSI